jgi:mercuric ion transport protein
MTVHDAERETTSTASPPSAVRAASKWLAALGLAAGLGAVVASSCCIIPLGLAALGAGASVFSGLELVAEWRIPLLAVAGLAIAGGWGVWWMKRPFACASDSGCARSERARSTLALLLCGSAIVLAAAYWSHIDPLLLPLFQGR